MPREEKAGIVDLSTKLTSDMDGQREDETYVDVQIHMDVYDICDPLDEPGRTENIPGQSVPSYKVLLMETGGIWEMFKGTVGLSLGSWGKVARH